MSSVNEKHGRASRRNSSEPVPARLKAVMQATTAHSSMNIIVINRAAIESKSVSVIINQLEAIDAEDRPSYFRGLEWSISGYDDDPRELFAIPEVVLVLREIDKQWPKWAFYQHPFGRWTRALTLCLAGARFTALSQIKWDQQAVLSLYLRWSKALSQQASRYGIAHSEVVAADASLCRLMDLGRPLSPGEAA